MRLVYLVLFALPGDVLSTAAPTVYGGARGVQRGRGERGRAAAWMIVSAWFCDFSAFVAAVVNHKFSDDIGIAHCNLQCRNYRSQ